MKWFKQSAIGQYIIKARIIAANQKEMGDYGRSLRGLSLAESPKSKPDSIIESTYQEYVGSISTADKVISYELVAFLWHILQTIKPKLVIDLGSGFSSYLFRYYQSTAVEPCRVISCDDSEHWLERTHHFLRTKHLSSDDLMLWDTFITQCNNESPDLILDDLGQIPARIKTLPQILSLTRPQTLTIIDDLHKYQLRRSVLGQLPSMKYHVYDLTPITYDHFGRYAWMMTLRNTNDDHN